jgi:RimJ/RimL family protein N-acetyltransferase
MTSSNRYEINDEIYIDNSATKDDIPSFIKYLNNPKIYANTLRIPNPYTEKDGEDFIKKIESSSSDSVQIFAIRLKATNELIGACGLYRCQENERRKTIGYWLGEPYWNRGIMPKVVNKVIEIGKNQWKNLVRIEAQVYTWNKASMRVLEKCGFTFEGTLPKHIHKNGEDIDINSYALIFD